MIAEAPDGEVAMEKIVSLHPDVVLLDMQMPRMDGVETLRKLNAAGINSRVILLSVYAKDEQLFEGLRAGARGYLMKEATGAELVSAIRTVHQGGSLLQPAIADRLIERLHSGAESPLTGRELEVMRLVASGALNREIAEHLSVSLRTVRFHVENVFQKLGVRTRTQAVRVASEKGLLG